MLMYVHDNGWQKCDVENELVKNYQAFNCNVLFFYFFFKCHQRPVTTDT